MSIENAPTVPWILFGCVLPAGNAEASKADHRWKAVHPVFCRIGGPVSQKAERGPGRHPGTGRGVVQQQAQSDLWYKGGMIFVVLVSAIADGIMVVICGLLGEKTLQTK